MLREVRESWRMSVGEAAELSGVPAVTIAVMEAGLPVYPCTTFWRVAYAFAKHKSAVERRRRVRANIEASSGR
jgi:hypothetical protein